MRDSTDTAERPFCRTKSTPRNLDTPHPAAYGSRRFGAPGVWGGLVVGGATMSEHNTPDDLRSLDRRLNEARRDRRGTAAGDGKNDSALNSALGVGFRIGMELVVAVAAGLGLGWLIDKGLGTKPWAMTVFLFVGIAAGMLNVYRFMKGMGLAAGYRQAGPVKDEEDEED
jgi:ATP synthase protein I